MQTQKQSAPHPVIWLILYLPFGALGGFITIALTYYASLRGFSISEGALINGSQLLISWLKWLWAPVVDLSLTPRKWYIISTVLSAGGVVAMALVPLDEAHLPLLLAVIAGASFINTFVGMSIEHIIAATVADEDIGKVSGWFQAGNLGGNALGGGLGLYLIKVLVAPWMSAAVLGAIFIACCLALSWTPDEPDQDEGADPTGEEAYRTSARKPRKRESIGKAIAGVALGLGRMLKTKGGLLAAILCAVPVSTGAAQVVLTQGQVAEYWGATDNDVALVQGLFAGFIIMAGCLVGGYVCQSVRPQKAYVGIGLLLVAIAIAMSVCPATVWFYIVWNLIYAFGVGLAYAAFSAFTFEALGNGAGATKYNVYASLSNFPLWWLGLLLGVAAQKVGPRNMLLTEAGFGVVGVGIFAIASYLVRKSSLPEVERHLPPPLTPAATASSPSE